MRFGRLIDHSGKSRAKAIPVQQEIQMEKAQVSAELKIILTGNVAEVIPSTI
jgi:hypothetical protein